MVSMASMVSLVSLVSLVSMVSQVFVIEPNAERYPIDPESFLIDKL